METPTSLTPRVRQDEKILGIVRAAEGQVFRFPLTLRLL